MKPIINLEDVALEHHAHGDRFEARAGSIVEYPDSGKVFVCVGSALGADPAPRTFSFRGRLGSRVEYWDGE